MKVVYRAQVLDTSMDEYGNIYVETPDRAEGLELFDADRPVWLAEHGRPPIAFSRAELVHVGDETGASVDEREPAGPKTDIPLREPASRGEVARSDSSGGSASQANRSTQPDPEDASTSDRAQNTKPRDRDDTKSMFRGKGFYLELARVVERFVRGPPEAPPFQSSRFARRVRMADGSSVPVFESTRRSGARCLTIGRGNSIKDVVCETTDDRLFIDPATDVVLGRVDPQDAIELEHGPLAQAAERWYVKELERTQGAVFPWLRDQLTWLGGEEVFGVEPEVGDVVVGWRKGRWPEERYYARDGTPFESPDAARAHSRDIDPATLVSSAHPAKSPRPTLVGADATARVPWTVRPSDPEILTMGSEVEIVPFERVDPSLDSVTGDSSNVVLPSGEPFARPRRDWRWASSSIRQIGSPRRSGPRSRRRNN